MWSALLHRSNTSRNNYRSTLFHVHWLYTLHTSRSLSGNNSQLHVSEKHLTISCSLVQWSELWKLRNYDMRTPLGVCTVRALMLAVFKSLRNSSRLILPSLSMSASSRRGSMEPFIPVCCRQEQHVNNQPKYINNSISALFKIIQYSKMSMKNQKCMNNWVPVLVTN